MNTPKLPITRLSKFFSEDDYDLHMNMGIEYLHGDLNMTLVLYRVDRTRSETDDVYGESGKDSSRNEVRRENSSMPSRYYRSGEVKAYNRVNGKHQRS